MGRHFTFGWPRFSARWGACCPHTLVQWWIKAKADIINASIANHNGDDPLAILNSGDGSVHMMLLVWWAMWTGAKCYFGSCDTNTFGDVWCFAMGIATKRQHWRARFTRQCWTAKRSPVHRMALTRYSPPFKRDPRWGAQHRRSLMATRTSPTWVFRQRCCECGDYRHNQKVSTCKHLMTISIQMHFWRPILFTPINLACELKSRAMWCVWKVRFKESTTAILSLKLKTTNG